MSAVFQEQTSSGEDVSISGGTLTLQKHLTVDVISNHFLEPLSGQIRVQGKMSKNRWIGEDGIFQCRSRGSCSVNLQAEYNRKKDILSTWTLPNGEIFVGKNPPSFKIPYGDFVVKVTLSDTITSETSDIELHIHH